MTLREIGKVYEVTRERIRQIEQKALGKLRSSLTIMKLARECGIKIALGTYEAAKESEVKSKLIFRSNYLSPIEKSETSSVTSLIKTVSEFYGVGEADVLGSGRSADLVKPRHVSMYLLREDTGISFPKIAQVFDSRDHATVIHAHRKIKDALEEDGVLAEELNKIVGILHPNKSTSLEFISPIEVIKKVADFYHINEGLVYNGSESAEVVKARQCLTYIFKDVFKFSTEDIARKLGGRTINTITAWYDAIQNLIQCDPKTAKEIEKIKAILSSD